MATPLTSACVHAKSLQSCLTLCDPMTVAHQASLCLGLSRQEYWSGLPCPPPGGLPTQGTNWHLLHLLQWHCLGSPNAGVALKEPRRQRGDGSGHPRSLRNACPTEQGQQCHGKRFHSGKTDPIVLIHNQNVIQRVLEKSLFVIALMTREIRASSFTHTFHLHCLCQGGI